MITIVDKENSSEKLTKGSIYADVNCLTVSPSEIMFLKIEDDIVINKYVTGYERLSFSNGGNMYVDSSHYKAVFNNDIPYISYGGHIDFSLYGEYYTRIKSETLGSKETLLLSSEEEDVELTKKELEEIFNPGLYDSMYITGNNGSILYASNTSDGNVIGNNPISIITNSKTKKILITSNKGVFNVNMFRISKLEDENYRMNISKFNSSSLNREHIIQSIKQTNDYRNCFVDKYSKKKIYKKAI